MGFLQLKKPVHLTIPGLEEVRIPPMVKIRQRFAADHLEQPVEHLRQQLHEAFGSGACWQGKNLCITVGSRGIPHLADLVRCLVETLQGFGAKPFIIPSMGSHGGATVAGQLEILEGYGVTEAAMGAPIRATLDVVEIGRLPDDTPVYCDRYAAAADGIVFLNKIKPHTDFRGPHESGLAKMMAIGIANPAGASMFHRMGFASFAQRIPQVCEVFLKKLPVAFGVGIVQNAYDEISELEVIQPDDFLARDAALLECAKARLPRFLHPHLDVLIIDQIGKNISGNGHDPNVTGRSNSPGFATALSLQKLFIRGLTPESHFNGAGLNHADITLRQVIESLDLEATWTNVATVNLLRAAALPMFVESDREAIEICIRTCLGIDYQQAKLARILDTLHLDTFEVSWPYWLTVSDHPDIERLSEPYCWCFDPAGQLQAQTRSPTKEEQTLYGL